MGTHIPVIKIVNALHKDRPLPMYAPVPTLKEHILFCMSSTVSIIAGVYLSYVIFMLNDVRFLALTGLVHSIVFGGMLWFTKFELYRALLYLILCALFPFWGIIFQISGLHLVSVLMSSTIWGLILGYILEDAAAFIVFLLIGCVHLITHIAAGYYFQNAVPPWFMPSESGYWLVTGSCAVLAVFGSDDERSAESLH